MKALRLCLVAFLFLLALPGSLPAQNPQLELKEVKWSFPKVGMQLKDIGGVQAYDLGNNVYGVEDTNNGLSIRLIFIPSSIVVAAEKVHREDSAGMPDVNKFLTAYAVKLAVETPTDFTNGFIGIGKLEGHALYLYKTKSGANVGAVVSDDQRRILIMPAPSEK
jgi:hypothetical protein